MATKAVKYIGISLGLLVYIYQPYQLPCPLHFVTGLNCAMCGITRAASTLIIGSLNSGYLEWRQALAYNPLIFPVLVVAVAMITLNLIPTKPRNAISNTIAEIQKSKATNWVLLVVLLAFTTVRNLDTYSGWHLAPHTYEEAKQLKVSN